MPVITAIKPQKKRRRFNVYLDGKFGFALSAGTLVKSGLATDQNLSQDEVKKLKDQNTETKFYDRTLRFLSYRPRSEKEIKDYLQRKKCQPKTITRIIKKLKKLDLINDQSFARWWIEQRIQLRPKGKQALRFELWQKGVEKEIVEACLFSDKEESSLAKKVAQKKKKSYHHLKPLEFRQKMTAFLARRGFSWRIIKKTLEEILKKR